MADETAAAVEPAKPKTDAKPEGWEKLRREGSAEGAPEVGFDVRRHKPFHVNSAGEIQWHQAPEGFRFDKSGELVPEKAEG